jgi:2-oxoglutarate/2-oxoacid ferredoxin oxidoreductase subunit beta
MPVPTSAPPAVPGHRVHGQLPALQLAAEHRLCAGCGHGVAWPLILEVLSELKIEQSSIMVIGHGCYTGLAMVADIDMLQCLHGRAPAVATGIKRMRRDTTVFSVQGDGDLASEGLHEIIHAAGRGERITSIMLNNGVFGDTGGQMTGATVLGQRTKTSLEGRDAELHGYPIPVADILGLLPGVAYVARGAVNTAAAAAQAKRFLRKAFEAQISGEGFSFVEILTMCPTGWFVGAPDGPGYISDTVEGTFPLGEIKA